jgi:tungstate transport system substrate-binding protein
LGAALPLVACAKPKSEPTSPAASRLIAVKEPLLIRVASVPTAVEGNLMPSLVTEFENQSSYKVELTSTSQVYDRARAGDVDLAISHYGHKHAEQFVVDGYGEWPRTLFSNQMALLGPPSDPANVRGLQDVGEAFRRIAEKKARYVINGIDGVRYLTEILWNAAGRPNRSGWLIDEGQKKEEAVKTASDKGAYILWGLTPFLRVTHGDPPPKLEPLVTADPLLQRMLVSIIVKATKVPGTNEAGAGALQAFLLSPVTQARIREIRYPGSAHVAWVPGGRHNRTAMLPKA